MIILSKPEEICLRAETWTTSKPPYFRSIMFQSSKLSYRGENLYF